MDLKLVTAPQLQNAFATPMTAQFSTQQRAAVISPRANTAPANRTASSFFGIPRNQSISLVNTEDDLSHVEPDELFVRFTVGQVKSLATKLRADSDTKQEELRLMVGERYRDLLQASTSIIDMTASSQSVVDILQEMRDTCAEQSISIVPTSSRSVNETDLQLKTLQSLAAHMKLLLDCPEQFWKLLEARQYLDAAWLFLVARVVHHSLVDEEEDAVWTDQGIDVLGQFPLVQRQWNAINGFRNQISHRAVQSLREEMTVQETMHAAISLFLLDSMSLSDTLGVLLSQRTKSVQAFFSSDKQDGNSAKGQKQGLLEANGLESKRGRRKVIREVKRALCEAIDLLVGTMHTIRLIYSPEVSKPSSVESLLIEIQTDGQDSIISTSKVLGKLPSASLLDLYLPLSIKSYVPYIDTTGTSTHLTGDTVSLKLEKWFESNLNTLGGKLEHWVDAISNARDVDDVRSAALAAPSFHQLSAIEQAMTTACVESVCSKRIVEIWRLAFQSLREEFAVSLSKSLELIKTSDPVSKADLNPTGSLSSNLPYPLSTRANHSQSTVDLAFNNFNTALKQRRSNRTPLLEAIVSTVEGRLKELQRELESAAAGKFARDILLTQFGPLEDQLGACLLQCLGEKLDQVAESHDEVAMNLVVFLGRIVACLSASSPFVEDKLGSGKSIEDFQFMANEVHSRTLSVWRLRIFGQLSNSLGPLLSPVSGENVIDAADVVVYTRPSPGLLEALVTLTSAAYQLGLSHQQIQEKQVLRDVLDQLSQRCFQLVQVDSLQVSNSTSQLLWDLYFLKALCREAGMQDRGDDTLKKFQSRMETLMAPKAAKALVVNTESAVTQALPRFQILLFHFLTRSGEGTTAPGASSLLSRGIPLAESTPAPTLVLAKPSPRFGLLLVPGSVRTTLR